MTELSGWYIVKNVTGTCDIIPDTEISQVQITDRWGPFSTKTQALASRIGLIRSGKCQPVQHPFTG